MLQTLKMLVVIFLVVWTLNFLRRIHSHFWIESIPKLGDKKTALGTNVSFNDFMRANKSDVANSPKNIYLLARNATCSVSFEWHLWRITLTSFHQKKHVFHLATRWLPPLCLLYITEEICARQRQKRSMCVNRSLQINELFLQLHHFWNCENSKLKNWELKFPVLCNVSAGYVTVCSICLTHPCSRDSY